MCNAAVAESFHVRATPATIRTRLFAIPARIARSAHRLHLPPAMALGNRGVSDFHHRRWTTRPARPDHPAPAGHNQGLRWKARTGRHPTRAQSEPRGPDPIRPSPSESVNRGCAVVRTRKAAIAVAGRYPHLSVPRYKCPRCGVLGCFSVRLRKPRPALPLAVSPRPGSKDVRSEVRPRRH